MDCAALGGSAESRWREELCRACNGTVLFTNDSFFCVMNSQDDMACVNWEVASLRGVDLRPLLLPPETLQGVAESRNVRKPRDDSDTEYIEDDGEALAEKPSLLKNIAEIALGKSSMRKDEEKPQDYLLRPFELPVFELPVTVGKSRSTDNPWDSRSRQNHPTHRLHQDGRRRELWGDGRRRESWTEDVDHERPNWRQGYGREAGLHEVRLGGGDAFHARTEFSRGDRPPWTAPPWSTNPWQNNRPPHSAEDDSPQKRPVVEVLSGHPGEERHFRGMYPDDGYRHNVFEPSSGRIDGSYLPSLHSDLPPYNHPTRGYPEEADFLSPGYSVPPSHHEICVDSVLQYLSDKGYLRDEERREAVRELLEREGPERTRLIERALKTRQIHDPSLSVSTSGLNPNPSKIAEQIAASIARATERLFLPPSFATQPAGVSTNLKQEPSWTRTVTEAPSFAKTAVHKQPSKSQHELTSSDVYSVGPMFTPPLSRLFKLPSFPPKSTVI